MMAYHQILKKTQEALDRSTGFMTRRIVVNDNPLTKLPKTQQIKRREARR